MIHDVLFSPPQSPIFVLLKVSFLLSPSPCFALLKVSFLLPPSPFPILSVLFLHLKVLSHPPPSPAPILSDSSPILFVLSPPPPQSQRKQRNDTKPSRRSRWLVVVGFKTEHSSPPPLLGTTLTREPRWWRSRRRPRPIWRRPHWCQG